VKSPLFGEEQAISNIEIVSNAGCLSASIDRICKTMITHTCIDVVKVTDVLSR
jgi:hypothetical protein